MPVINELVRADEHPYVPTSLAQSGMNCADDRVEEHYIHIFGGALNIPFNLAVMQEAEQPGSVTASLETIVAEVVPIVREKGGVRQGVHSDTETEQGDHFHIDQRDGEIGCGYGNKRKEISLHTAKIGSQIVARAAELCPELFNEQSDYDFADDVIGAHSRLARREGFLSSGRRTAMAAIDKGADTMIVRGPHKATKGKINRWPNTSLDGRAADEIGKPLYSPDEWAVREIHEKIHDDYPYDERKLQIAHLIDDLGVMNFLGVELENIQVRSAPEAA